MSYKSFESRNRLRDINSNCMPKISLIGWVQNFALFWQLFICHELSSCHKKVLTPEMDWGIWNLTVFQKSVCLVEIEISPYLDSLSVVTSCQVVKKKFDYRIWLGDSISNCMPKINLISWVWNFALFWQLISCYELSSCKKNLPQKLIKGLWI